MKRSIIVIFSILVFSTFLSANTNIFSIIDGSNFNNVKVYPQYRLPNKDLTIEWSTPSTGGVIISYGDNKITEASEGQLVIPASKLSTMPETFEIELKVNSYNGEEKRIKIETFYEPRKIKMAIKQGGYNDKYLINFNNQEWDKDLVIQNIELDSPKSYYIQKTSLSIEYREIYTKWEYYNKAQNISGYLNWKNQYESTGGLPAAPKGTWTFRFWNYPWMFDEDEIQPTYLNPDIIFTIGAKQDSTISY